MRVLNHFAGLESEINNPMSFRPSFPVVCVLSLILMVGCSGNHHNAVDVSLDVKPIGSPIEIKTPLGLPTVPIPPGEPETAETIDLGRELFYEKKLSMNDTRACASCHNPLLGFTDGQKYSTGVGEKLAPVTHPLF